MNSFEHGHITEEDKDRMIKELTEKANGEGKAKTEAEEKAKLEEEAKAKLEAEEKAKLEEAEKLKAKADKLREEIEDLDKISSKPLVAINADFSIDRKDLAHQQAQTILNKEKAEGNYFKRLWKGTLFAKYFQKKYERELLKGTRETVDGKKIDDLIDERKSGAMERFELAATETVKFLHAEIGKKSKDGTYKEGETLDKADEKTQEFVKEAITSFVEEAKKNEGKYNSDELKNQFIEQFNRKVEEAREKGEKIDTDVTNYGDVALQALELSMHGVAMEKVMEGFMVYNAKANDEIRTVEHRDAVDKIVDAIESSKIGQVIPAEIIALSVGTAASLAQMGARTAASAVAPAFGGILVSSAISGLRERNRITEDRAHMMRDIANGLEYGAEGGAKSRKREKYEKRIGGTLYDLRSASELTENIKEALQTEGEGRGEAVLSALAEARVRRDFSDSEQKDLISFSSAGNRGNERLELDKALIRAEESLSDEDKTKYEEIKAAVLTRITEGYTTDDGEHIAGVNEQDKKFANRRALMATAKAGKTMLIGAATFFVSQEVIAAIDPTKIGIFEKAGLLKTQNRESASETLLASGFGLNRGMYNKIIGQNKVTVNSDDTQQIQKLNQEGYTGRMVNKAYTTTEKKLIEVDPSSSNLATPSKIDAWADNGTDVPDKAELGIHFLKGGRVDFRPTVGSSTTRSGEVINFDQIAADNKLEGFVTIGGNRFKVLMTGKNEWGNNGVFDVVGQDGTVGSIKLFDGDKFLGKYFEVVKNNGVIDGVEHITPIATATGPDSVVDKITQVVETTVEHPAVYEYSKTLTENVIRDVTGVGIAFAPDTARTGLGVATPRSEQAPRPPVEQPTQPTDNRPPVNTFGGNPEPTPEQSTEQPDQPVPNSVASTEQAPTESEDDAETPEEAERKRRIELEQQRKEENENFMGFIYNIPGLDDLGQQMLTNQGTDGERQYSAEEYSNWWNGLSDETKSYVRAALTMRERMRSLRSDRGDDTEVRYGQGLINWLALNDGNVASAPNVA
jgi:hypothetical protein